MTTLPAGSRLGSYTISGPLGAGGMGEVYRARDARLDRDVAIKILPPALAADRAALARFEREAKAVAAVSHPNIVAIHDFGTEGTTVYAVMELLEGETLRDRLERGPLPTRKAVEIAVQIAHGLAAAHARGFIHRDLKPANVFVGHDGRIKILDFGVAKARAVDADASETIAARDGDTAPGMVVGTVGYMSPEQITGGPVDPRTDIFAFGSVLYEMLSGRRPFDRDSSAETIAAILKEDVPELSAAAAVPAPLERIVHRCLEKNPAERFHSAHDIGLALEALEDRSTTSAAATSPRPASRAPARAVIAASTIAALAVGVLTGILWSGRRAPGDPAPSRVRKFHVTPPRLEAGRTARPVISPDGEKIAFAAGDSLWIQELNQLDARQLTTRWRPDGLFWSPDSASVGFFSDGRLWKVAVGGGEEIALADVSRTGGGALGAWRSDGRIVLSRSVDNSGLLEVPQDGGELRTIAALQDDDIDLHDPALLPGDDGYLLVVHGADGPDTIAAARGGTRKEILRLPGEQILFPQYSATGHLIFGRAGKSLGVWAVPFDPGQLATTGEPFLIAAGALFPSLSRDGTLTFLRRIWTEPRQLVIVNRSGAIERAVGEPQPGLGAPVVAPDGRRVAVRLGSSQADIWIYDLEQGGRTRLTFLENGGISPLAWTARNRLLYEYGVTGRLRSALAMQAADGSGEVEQLGEGFAASQSTAGSMMVFANINDAEEANADLFYRGPGDTAPKPFLQRPGDQVDPQLSPGGAYVAYRSNESGRNEVYIRPFPTGAGQWQVSVRGGGEPRWSPKGDRIWFRAFGNVLMEADVTIGTTLAVSEPREVFKGDPIAVDLTLDYAAIDNGERFVAARRTADPDGSTPSITVVQNWFAEFANRR